MAKINPPNNLIYHYCSTETFYKIMTSRCLWMTDISSMNDYLEKKWVSEIFLEYIHTNKTSNQELYNALWWEYANQHLSVFMCCFALDGDLLSQWRGYADDGNGVAIGFSPSNFNQAGNDSKLIDFTQPLLHKVEYEERESVLTLIDNVIKDLSQQQNLEDNAQKIIKKIKLMEMTYKNPAFREEKEYRLIYAPKIYVHGTYIDGEPRKSIQISDGENQNMKFRYKRNAIIPYFEFPLSSDSIQWVMLGPKYEKEKADYIEAFLLSNDFDVKHGTTQYSKASYR